MGHKYVAVGLESEIFQNPVFFYRWVQLELGASTIREQCVVSAKSPFLLDSHYPRVFFNHSLHDVLTDALLEGLFLHPETKVMLISQPEHFRRAWASIGHWYQLSNGTQLQNLPAQAKFIELVDGFCALDIDTAKFSNLVVYGISEYQGLSMIMLKNKPQPQILDEFSNLFIHMGCLPSSQSMKRQAVFFLNQKLGIQKNVYEDMRFSSPIPMAQLIQEGASVLQQYPSASEGMKILVQVVLGSLSLLQAFGGSEDAYKEKDFSLYYAGSSLRIHSQIQRMGHALVANDFVECVTQYRGIIEELYAWVSSMYRPTLPAFLQTITKIQRGWYDTPLPGKYFLARSGMNAHTSILSALQKMYGKDIIGLYSDGLYYERRNLMRRVAAFSEEPLSILDKSMFLCNSKPNVLMIEKHLLQSQASQRNTVDVSQYVQSRIRSEEISWPLSIVIDTVFDLKGDAWHQAFLADMGPYIDSGQAQVVFFDSGHKFWAPFGQRKMDFSLICCFNVPAQNQVFARFNEDLNMLTGLPDTDLGHIQLMLELSDLNNRYQTLASQNANFVYAHMDPVFKVFGKHSDTIFLVEKNNESLPFIELEFRDVAKMPAEQAWVDIFKQQNIHILWQDGFSFEETSIAMLGPSRIRFSFGLESQATILKMTTILNQVCLELIG